MCSCSVSSCLCGSDFKREACDELRRIFVLGAEGAEGEGVVAFGEALAGVVGHERAVIKGGSRNAEGAEEEELAESGFDEVGAADDFGDVEIRVVDGGSKLVAGHVVFPPDEEIAEVAAGDGALRAEMVIVEDEFFVVGNTEAPVGRDAIGQWGKRSVAGRAKGIGIDGFVVKMRGAGSFGDVAAGSRARENETGGVEAGEGGAVEQDALALRDDGAVPGQAEPVQIFLEGGDEFRATAGGVEIVVAEEERAAGLAGALMSDPERACVAKVKVARG